MELDDMQSAKEHAWQHFLLSKKTSCTKEKGKNPTSSFQLDHSTHSTHHTSLRIRLREEEGCRVKEGRVCSLQQPHALSFTSITLDLHYLYVF